MSSEMVLTMTLPSSSDSYKVKKDNQIIQPIYSEVSHILHPTYNTSILTLTPSCASVANSL